MFSLPVWFTSRTSALIVKAINTDISDYLPISDLYCVLLNTPPNGRLYIQDENPAPSSTSELIRDLSTIPWFETTSFQIIILLTTILGLAALSYMIFRHLYLEDLVHARTKEIEEARLDLEKRVEERTAELIAAKQKLEEEINHREKIQNALVATQKQEAFGKLARGMAHNINNLLTGVIGNLSLATRKCNDETIPYIKKSQDAANRAASLIENLLTFSQQKEASMTWVEPESIINYSTKLMKDALEASIELRINIPENLPKVYADTNLIHSVIMQMFLNARDAVREIVRFGNMPERRRESFFIKIDIHCKEFSENYPFPNKEIQPGRYVVFAIEDNGIGIEQQNQQHIFDPFFTTKATVGTGLGLTGAESIIRQHNGWIDFESTYKQGSIFRFYLPAENEVESL